VARGDSLARQLQLWMLLDRERSLSVDEVCNRLGIKKRTLYRDLNVLQRCGMPLWQEPVGKTVRWRLDDGFRRTLNVQLSVQEVMALVAAERLLSSMAGTIFATAAETAVQKLKEPLAAPIRERLSRLTSHVSVSSGPARNLGRHRDELNALLDAVERTLVVELSYQRLGAGLPQMYTVEPHHVHVHGSSVYLVAWALERKAPRIFLLDRVRRVKVLPRSFTRRKELPTGVFEQGAFGLWEGKAEHVRLRFKGTAVRIVSEQRLHPTQRITAGPRGTADFEMQVPVSPPLVAWIRGFKGRVEVLGPAQLMNEL
jgi:predicted DNA-binding transcriptional regulator YafY